jgi:hypothetical protein
MSHYPPEHHPVFFLINALKELGANAQFVKDERSLGCWGILVNGKLVVYLIDNRLPHEAEKEDPAATELLKRGAVVACAQKPDAERIGAKWLPLAVTPGYRPPDKPVEKLYDVGFVGYVRDEGRERILRHVARHFKVGIGQGLFGDDAVSLYWQSRVGLNIPTQYGSPTAYDSANMRCFEILATGTLLVTSGESYLDELHLVPLINYYFYKTADELIETIRVVIGMQQHHPDKVAEVGPNGAKVAQAYHTYRHRAEQVLSWLK